MRHFQDQLIILCVRWPFRCSLSTEICSTHGETDAHSRSHDRVAGFGIGPLIGLLPVHRQSRAKLYYRHALPVPLA
jgi:hypothetical protein